MKLDFKHSKAYNTLGHRADSGGPVFVGKEEIYLEKELYAGRFEEVISASLDNPNYHLIASDFPWILASLSFLGRHEELIGFYRLQEKLNLSPSQDCLSRFFYGLSFCRRREFQKSRQLFMQNFLRYKSSTDSLIRFYIYQGLAFFRYSTGFLEEAKYWSLRALSESSSSLNLFASVLAHELLGHTLCNLGFLSEGFKKLEIATKKSQMLGRGAIESAAQAVLTLYRSSFALSSAENLMSELSLALEKIKHSESYSKASLSLEIAHLRILMGDLKEAKTTLDKISHLIYEVNNPYLEIKYNLNLAYLMYLEGELSMAQVLLKASIDKAREKFHLALLVKAQGLLYKIFVESEKQELAQTLLLDLERNTLRNGSNVAKRILARQRFKSLEKIKAGEDLMGDMIDKIKASPQIAISEILNSGYYLFLSQVLNVKSQDKILYFDIRYKFITIFNKGSVYQTEQCYTEFSRKLLSLLGSVDHLDKEVFVREIWDQAYDPIRHDGLIYSLVNRTRKLLGPYAQWLENSEEGYYLSSGVKVNFHSQVEQVKFEQQEHIISDKPLATTLRSKTFLTSRQLEILNLLKVNPHLSTRVLVEHFQVSEATASRDLAKLHDDGYLNKHGKGRATVFDLKELS
jgi:hypothetical protein